MNQILALGAASTAPGRDGGWLARPGLGVYVHIPFCLHRCHYCDFNTYEGVEELFKPYVDAIVRDIERYPGTDPRYPPATSVFFGGGTPTLLPPEGLDRILRAVGTTIGIAPGAEISIEANPETVDAAYFEAILKAGFNRVSVGVQSLASRVLVGLGRTHDAAGALGAIAAARSAGVADVNVDLIYGSPWESEGDWIQSLQGVVESEPDHVSAYALTVEEGTPLATLVRTGRMQDVDPDVQATRHEGASEILGAAGYERYEISNWAQPTRASAHNVLYWSAGNYLGFGAGAHGHLDGRRSWSVRLPREFIEAVRSDSSTESGSETLEQDARAGEAFMLGLRLRTGIDLDAFVARFTTESLDKRQPVLDDLVRAGLLETDGGWIRLTERATLVANDVACRLL